MTSSCNPNTGDFFLTWQDSNAGSPAPYFVIYNSGSFTTTPAIIPGGILCASSSVFSSCNPATGDFFVTWQYLSTIYYAIHHSDTSWTGPTQIPTAATGASDVFSSFMPTTGNDGVFFVTWQNASNTPSYAIYDTQSSTWTTPASVIPGSSQSAGDVFSSVNPTTGDILVTWQNSDASPYYAIYNSGTWTTSQQLIPNSNPVLYERVFSSCNPTTGDFLVTMVDFASDAPLYAVYNAATSTTTQWTVSPGDIPLSQVTNGPVFSSCNPTTGAFLATWQDGTSGQPSSETPFYSVRIESTPIPPSPPVHPPIGFTGKQKVNNFGVVKERYNALSWQQELDVDSYLLYRNGTLIASLNGNATSYDDHNQPKNSQTYRLTAENTEGQHASATISVGK